MANSAARAAFCAVKPPSTALRIAQKLLEDLLNMQSGKASGGGLRPNGHIILVFFARVGDDGHGRRQTAHLAHRAPHILPDLPGQKRPKHQMIGGGRQRATQPSASQRNARPAATSAMQCAGAVVGGHETPMAHSGILSCFFHGFWRLLPLSAAKARTTRRRVEWGMITSSINPFSAATKGLANRSS